MAGLDSKAVASTMITGVVVGLGSYVVARFFLEKSTKTSKTWGLYGGGIITALSLLEDMRTA